MSRRKSAKERDDLLRERFEAAIVAKFGNAFTLMKDGDGDYCMPETIGAWWAWQAALAGGAPQTPAAGALREPIEQLRAMCECDGQVMGGVNLTAAIVHRYCTQALAAPPQPTAQQAGGAELEDALAWAERDRPCIENYSRHVLRVLAAEVRRLQAQPTAQEPPDLVQRSSSDCTTVPGLSGDALVAEPLTFEWRCGPCGTWNHADNKGDYALFDRTQGVGVDSREDTQAGVGHVQPFQTLCRADRHCRR